MGVRLGRAATQMTHSGHQPVEQILVRSAFRFGNLGR